MPSLDITIALLHQYGYLFLLVISVLEGPIISIVGAFLAVQGFFNLYLVFIVVVAGDMIGDLLFYGIGRFGRIPLVERLGRSLGLTPERYRALEEYFKVHGVKALFYAKYTQTGIVALPAAGAARMPVSEFFWWNLLGTVPKSIALMAVGYFFGYAYQQIDSYMARASLILFATACIVGVVLFARQKKTLSAP